MIKQAGKSVYGFPLSSLIGQVGNTPMIRLAKLASNPRVSVFAKLEGDNPGGSVKDRPATMMIMEAEKRGILKPGVTIIEPTSGNTGIALAMIASCRGYKMELVMPENATQERVTTMKAYGAEVTLTSAEGSMEGARDYAEKMAKDHPEKYIMLDQFSNTDNPLAHYRGTGPEIWRDTNQKVTHFVSSMGTTGTIMGVSRFLKEQNQNIQIVGVQPTDGSRIPGIRRWPKEYLPTIFESERVDSVIDVSQEAAENITLRMALEEGIFCGMSSGGAMSVALDIASELEEGVVVCITCDRGDKYLSMDMFPK